VISLHEAHAVAALRIDWVGVLLARPVACRAPGA
jgi:hypothetical protein